MKISKFISTEKKVNIVSSVGTIMNSSPIYASVAQAYIDTNLAGNKDFKIIDVKF